MPFEYHIEKIVVEKPAPDQEPFFGITLQKVSFGPGGEIVAVKNRHDVLYVRESDMAADEVDIHDPITDEDIHVSGDGAYFALLRVCKDMIAFNKAYKIGAGGELVDE